MREEVKAAFKPMKNEKSAGVANKTITGWERSCDRHPYSNLQQDLADRRVTNSMDKVYGYHTFEKRQFTKVPKLLFFKGNLKIIKIKKQCQNYATISLINHPSKIMLKIILHRFQPQA